MEMEMDKQGNHIPLPPLDDEWLSGQPSNRAYATNVMKLVLNSVLLKVK
jgi:hypothetical protein